MGLGEILNEIVSFTKIELEYANGYVLLYNSLLLRQGSQYECWFCLYSVFQTLMICVGV